MEGEGWTSRDVSHATGGEVSHATVENWLKDLTQAGVDQVGRVANVFGWSTEELLFGRPGADTMNRVAELESALRRLRRGSVETRGILAGVLPDPDPALDQFVPSDSPAKTARPKPTQKVGRGGKG